MCEYANPVYIEFVRAYIPDEQEWESPPVSPTQNKKRDKSEQPNCSNLRRAPGSKRMETDYFIYDDDGISIDSYRYVIHLQLFTPTAR